VPRLWSSQLSDIRIWSAGCASGEEAFSMAMLFHRHAAVNGMLGQIERVEVMGTDVDAGAVGEAERATYSEPDLADVPAALRARYFSAGPPFTPSAGVRRMVRFARQDLLTLDYPAALQHVIICRNVLIYFERAVQEQVIWKLRESLEPGGYLILGRVESLIGQTRRGFEAVAQRERIFRKVS
jgi:chemotaxis methyl-accepting protein methylase